MSFNSTNLPAIHDLLQINTAEITTLVDAGIEIEGVLRNTSERTMLISGKVVGGIDSQGPVIINQGGEVLGFINAKSLQLGGKVLRRNESDVMRITGTLIVAKTAHMGCDVECGGILMEHGATPDGAVRIVKQRAEAARTPEVVRALHPVAPVPVQDPVQQPQGIIPRPAGFDSQSLEVAAG